MTFLLNTNVLLARIWEAHQHHTRARDWLQGVETFATCPLTQGGFLRISSNPSFPFATPIADAIAALRSLIADPRHEFWPDNFSFTSPEFDHTNLSSHKHVTDQYLVQLARHRNGSLATFDAEIARIAGDTGVTLLL